ncbi:MAG: hypothetical protein QOF57_2742, partial [Frankiaceae bacterium]|nr:hypothetical protein [Frankiaceae bacterium]
MKFVRGGRVAVTGVFAIAGVFVLPGLGGLAVAHVGVGPVIVTQAGPFTVSAYDGVLAPNSQAAYRALVTLTAGRGEVNDATVTVTADLA